jgi:capsule polysaccharide export protein KpsE/RkpR
MAMMLGRLHEALIQAGAPEDKAREAAEEVAQFENRLAKVQTDLAVLKAMVGTNTAGIAIILIKLFTN